MDDFRVFLTGSHAYGTPTPKSDIDLVILCSKEEYRKLFHKSDYTQEMTDPYKEGGLDTAPLRFGRLNLICCFSKESYKIWKECTEELKQKAPVTREEAVKLISGRRKSSKVA
jgi:predicted nucleotidyltransferase